MLEVALTGTVPSGLPTPVAPDLSLIAPLFPAAIGIALMSFVESIAADRAMTHADEHEPDADRAMTHADEHEPDADRELLALGVLQGVLIGVLASMMALVHALDHPHIERLEDGSIRVHGPLYFANVQRVRRRILALDADPRLDMSAVTGIDVTAALAMADLAPRMHGLDAHSRRVMRHVSPALGDPA